MTKVLLSLHVLAAIVAIGPVTVGASMFPAALRRGDLPAMRTLNRICRVYAAVGLAVPVFGLATAQSLGVLTSPWLLTSIALTVAAAAVLGFAVLPAQSTAQSTALAAAAVPVVAAIRAVEPVDLAGSSASLSRRLGMTAGVFNLLWTIVVVLMIVRPGSTTGA